MNGNPHKNQEIFLSAQTIISALEQLRENRYSFAKHIHKSIEIYLIHRLLFHGHRQPEGSVYRR